MTTREVKISTGETVLLVIALASKKAGITKFSEKALYAVFQKLTKEFPNYFQGLHWRFLVGGFPYCGEFEDILFRAAGCLLRTGFWMNELLMEEKTADIEIKLAKKHYGEDVVNEIEAVVERFIELISKEKRNRIK